MSSPRTRPPPTRTGTPRERRAPAPLTVQESRLSLPFAPGRAPVAQEFLEQSGFDALVAEFLGAVAAVNSLGELAATVSRHGRTLWETAVARAQGSWSGGTLDVLTDAAFEDDRRAIVEQTVALVLAAAGAVARGRGQRSPSERSR